MSHIRVVLTTKEVKPVDKVGSVETSEDLDTSKSKLKDEKSKLKFKNKIVNALGGKKKEK
jgi:hypothetical protein